MSQRELAKKLGISSAAVGMYETGKRSPSLNKAIEIAKIFEVSVENISFSNMYEAHELVRVSVEAETTNTQLSIFDIEASRERRT